MVTEVQARGGAKVMQVPLKDTVKVKLFRDLDDIGVARMFNIGRTRLYEEGEICQREGETARNVEIILMGRVGVEADIRGYLGGSKVILDTFGPGDGFGMSALIKHPSWSTLRVLEPTEVLTIDGEELLALCQEDESVGYVIMKNLADIATSRLRHARVSMFNAMMGIKVFNL